jgi:hypothetical protein
MTRRKKLEDDLPTEVPLSDEPVVKKRRRRQTDDEREADAMMDSLLKNYRTPEVVPTN